MVLIIFCLNGVITDTSLSWDLNNRRYLIGSMQSGEDQMKSVGKAKAGASAGCREAVEFFNPIA
jgi:hypothetical protein